ncbi:MAG: DUF1917 domain-containing protein [Anaerolineae bacterium]|jgi:hypothetical protein|nr:DUF1917 domain-containing protein [Anaerolineae bacterium]
MSDDNNPTPPNLDLIQMVQRARMMHDADAKPSEMGGVYWVESKPNHPVSPPTPRAGLWVIQTDADGIDALWATVKAANERGELGYKAKASTSARRGGGDPRQRVVVVCVADSDDASEVERVRAALVGLGINAPMDYERG